MTPQIGVLIIHGMGDQKEDYASQFIKRLNLALGKRSQEVYIASCYWANILQEQQNNIMEKVMQSDEPCLRRVRKWMISNLGDPPGYLSAYFRGSGSAYDRIHATVRSALSEIENNLESSGQKPLIVLAHSLGSVIVSNFLWDEQHKHEVENSGSHFCRMGTLTTLITFGSNIPLFLPPVDKIECIQHPSELTPPHLRALCKWLNIYAAADVLGYPISKLWDNANGTQIIDEVINPWPLALPISRTPLAHSFYMRSNKFITRVASEITATLEQL
jgi:hypothetical protein